MSKRILSYNLTGIDGPINMPNKLIGGGVSPADVVNGECLIMLQWEGLYWLVPYEILVECDMLLKHRDKYEDSYNILPPVSITVQQCIPIPGETAKILLEL
ncbi:hypothetical protein [Neptuniibacter sp.]|uniref:hypothetical protein n=1 Tax=Neptuniibacter sp. TaxID=1962643 RepID=UPI00261C52D8|nr:hypothetical protein [Neptuniibacter sp.]MCP4598500.1 hypothetical protein [Neptuniibacter sp.]